LEDLDDELGDEDQSTPEEDLDDELRDEGQSTSEEDESDGSWEDEEWAGFGGELSKSDGSEDELVDNDDHEMTEEKQDRPSDPRPEAAGLFFYVHHIWVELYISFQDAIYRPD
jgi:hypothetical protein